MIVYIGRYSSKITFWIAYLSGTRTAIDKEEYSIDVIYNEFECYSLTAFWHTAALTEGEIDWLNDQDG